MPDERNMPQDEDAEEVEAHVRRPALTEDESGDDDEVEAHVRRPAAPPEHLSEPSE